MTRNDVTEAIIAAKIAKGLSWSDVAKVVGLSKEWVTAGCLGQMTFNAEQAGIIGKLLDLPADAVQRLQLVSYKGSLPTRIPTDPLIYRFYEHLPAQTARLEAWTRLHCELTNAALEERIDAWRKAGKSISDDDQQNALPEIKADRPEFIALGSHALQQTLRRLDLAFQSFFRRVKAGQTPGFPRFKAAKRFSGFAYPDPSGWKLMQHGKSGATLRIGSGKEAMSIRARGRHRFGPDAQPNDITLTRKGGAWFVSVTLRVPDDACARERTDDQRRGVDFRITDWATFDDGRTIANPRWVREELPKLERCSGSAPGRRKGRCASSALASASPGCMTGSRTCAGTACTRKQPGWCKVAPCWPRSN